MAQRTVVLKFLLLLTVTVQLSSAVTHSLKYFYTAVTPGINFPEFTVVGVVDGEQFAYYDSNIKKMIPKSEWIQKVVGDVAGYWDRETQKHQGWEEAFKANVATGMQRFNQTKGVHTAQVMYGCELDDDGTKREYMLYGYDGEDFISLDLKTLTWIAPVPQAVITKLEWERKGDASYQADYLENICIEWLQKYVGYGRATLERKVPPEVSLFQKTCSSPVVCDATGFFPKAVMISWQKNGEDLHEDVELRETLPNQDGTFQKRSILTVSPEELDRNQYTCVVQHSSLEEEIVLPVSGHRGLSGSRIRRSVAGNTGCKAGWGTSPSQEGGSVGIIIGVVAVLLAIVCGVGVFIWKKMLSSGFKSVPANPAA